LRFVVKYILLYFTQHRGDNHYASVLSVGVCTLSSGYVLIIMHANVIIFMDNTRPRGINRLIHPLILLFATISQSNIISLNITKYRSQAQQSNRAIQKAENTNKNLATA